MAPRDLTPKLVIESPTLVTSDCEIAEPLEL